MTKFIIEPIEGREAIQKNFVSLPQKAENYCDRHISLNERFSIIERGYNLVPTDMEDSVFEVKLISHSKKMNREELKAKLIEETKRQQKRMEANKKKSEKTENAQLAEPSSPKIEENDLENIDPAGATIPKSENADSVEPSSPISEQIDSQSEGGVC